MSPPGAGELVGRDSRGLRWLPPRLRFVSQHEWHEEVEPALRQWCAEAGPALRRVSVQIAHWTATVYSDAHEWLRLTGIDWRPVFPRGRSTVEVYISGALPAELVRAVGAGPERGTRQAIGIIDLAGGRCWIGGVQDYRGVRRAVLEALSGRVLLGRAGGRDTARWLGVPACTVEWARVPGRDHGIAFVGPHRLRTLHGFWLARYAESSALAGLDWCFFRPRRREALAADGYLLVPGQFLNWFPRLRATLALAEPAAPIELEARSRLLAFQAVEDFERGLQSGDLSPSELEALLNQLTASDNWLLVSPEELVGSERLADVAHVQTWIVFPAVTEQAKDGDGRNVLTPIDAAEVADAVLAECFAYHSAAAHDAAHRLLRQVLSGRHLRGFRADPALHPVLLQLLLRFAVAGLIRHARLVTEPLAEQAAAHLQLDPGTDRTGRWRHASGKPTRVLGMYRNNNELYALLALDDRLLHSDSIRDPFALILGVWPGQIADFFTRHRHLNPRRLFAAWLDW